MPSLFALQKLVPTKARASLEEGWPIWAGAFLRADSTAMHLNCIVKVTQRLASSKVVMWSKGPVDFFHSLIVYDAKLSSST